VSHTKVDSYICVLGLHSANRPSTSNAEECTASLLPARSTSVLPENDEVQISDTESDKQFQVEPPDAQVVRDSVATTSVTSKSHYVFNSPVVRDSVGTTTIGNVNVLPSDNVTSGPHYTFSNPMLQESGGARFDVHTNKQHFYNI